MYPLLIGDERRGRVILVNHDGASYYQIPNDHGARERGKDPTNSGLANVVGAESPTSGGVSRVHRADFNQTSSAST